MYQREVTEKYTEKNLDMTKLLLLQRRAKIYLLSLVINRFIGVPLYCST